MPPAKRRTARKTAAKKATARKPAKRRVARKTTREDGGTEAGQASHREEGAAKAEEGSGEASDREEGCEEAGAGEAPDRGEEGSGEAHGQEGQRTQAGGEEGCGDPYRQEGHPEAGGEEGGSEGTAKKATRSAQPRRLRQACTGEAPYAKKATKRHPRSAASPSAASQHQRRHCEGALRGPFFASELGRSA